MEGYPQAFEKDNSIIVKFGPDAETGKRLPIRMVLDFGRDGAVSGIEIINLVLKVGKRALDAIEKVAGRGASGPTYAYDGKSDSFYLRLKDDASVDQKSLQGAVILDDDARIVGLTADWR